MEIKDLAYEVRQGLINTGVESSFDGVSCSTNGDYPSMGVQQVEGIGGRGDELLSLIPGGDKFIGRAYSDIEAADELQELQNLLGSTEGTSAQLDILQRDTERYTGIVINAGLTDARCVIYAAMWCPTSEYVVSKFISRRIARGYDLKANLQCLYSTFHDEYADAAECSEYAEGYQNRADSTFEYVNDLDLSAYGI